LRWIHQQGNSGKKVQLGTAVPPGFQPFIAPLKPHNPTGKIWFRTLILSLPPVNAQDDRAKREDDRVKSWFDPVKRHFDRKKMDDDRVNARFGPLKPRAACLRLAYLVLNKDICPFDPGRSAPCPPDQT
jgi:hypothetical protein